MVRNQKQARLSSFFLAQIAVWDQAAQSQTLKIRPGHFHSLCGSFHYRYQSLNHEGRWGTTDDFATRFLHFSLFSTALWDLPNSRPVHSLMCPPLLCEGWGGHSLCLSGYSSVLIDLHWPCGCTAQSSILSIGSVSVALL